MSELTLKPIGYFRSNKQTPVEAARQATVDSSTSLGKIELLPGQNFEQALEDLVGFSHIWVVYGFHLNTQWKPKVDPPRGPGHKVGVFASRSPYRPNPVGMSALPLIKIEGLKLTVGAHDLLDGSPVYDLKPYLPFSDCIPAAKAGWTEGLTEKNYQIQFSEKAKIQLQFLQEKGGLTEIQSVLQSQLQFEPLNSQKKRVKPEDANGGVFSYKTWRARFTFHAESLVLEVSEIFSGYSAGELKLEEDPYSDKDLHRKFLKAIPS